MKIIYIGRNRAYQTSLIHKLKAVSEQDSICFFYSYQDAVDFINHSIVSEQLQLDLIITESNVLKKDAADFFQNIKRDKDRSFSKFDFKFCSLPVILILNKEENRIAYDHYGFNDIISGIEIEKIHLFTTEFVNAVKSWRKGVLDELDNLGIKFNSGSVDYSYYFSEIRKKVIETNILSENFKLIPRKLDYDWLSTNEKQIEVAIDEFIKEMKNATRLNKKKEEKKFHALFNKHPFLLKRDNYSEHKYEPRLHYSKKKYYEPDYSLKPNFNQRTDLSILEVKLPSEKFIKKTEFHPGPYKGILSHIFQVSDYKDYLESDEYHEEIKKAFGFIPESIEYNILVGRLDDKTSGLKVFNKRIKQMNMLHINFITYDELLEYQVKYLERTQLLKIL